MVSLCLNHLLFVTAVCQRTLRIYLLLGKIKSFSTNLQSSDLSCKILQKEYPVFQSTSKYIINLIIKLTKCSNTITLLRGTVIRDCNKAIVPVFSGLIYRSGTFLSHSSVVIELQVN